MYDVSPFCSPKSYITYRFRVEKDIRGTQLLFSEKICAKSVLTRLILQNWSQKNNVETWKLINYYSNGYNLFIHIVMCKIEWKLVYST